MSGSKTLRRRLIAGGNESLPTKAVATLHRAATKVRNAFRSLVHVVARLSSRWEVQTKPAAANQNRLIELLATVGAAIITIDSDERIVGFNQMAEQLFGYPAETALGRPLDLILPAESGLNHATQIQAFVRSCESMRLTGKGLEIRGRRRDGTEVVAEAAISQLVVDNEALFIAVLRDVTELRRVEANAKESEERFRDIAMLIGDWLWETDTNHRISMVGGQKSGDTGFSEEHVLGKTRWEIAEVEPEKDSHWARHIADIKACRPFRDFVYSARDRVGKRRYLASSGTPFFDANGAFKGYRGATKDITTEIEMRCELEQSRAELLESREGLVRAQKIGLIGSGEVDLVTGASRWSEETYAIMGLDPAGGSGLERFLSHVHPDDREQIKTQRALNERGEATDPLEYRFVRPDGQVRWFLRKVEVARDEQGAPVKLFTAHQDITERRKAEDERRRIAEKLRQSQEHLKRAQSLGLIGSSEVNLLTGEQIWSEEYFRLLGLDPATTKIDTSTFANAILPEDRSKLISFDSMLAQRGPIEPIELRVRRSDGKIYWLRRQIEVTRDAVGTPASILFTLQDISERKHTDEQLRRVSEHLSRVQSVAQIGSNEVDLQTGQVIWSDMFYRLLNLDPATTKPSHEAALSSVHPDDREALREARRRGQRGEQVAPIEFRVIKDNGEVRWLVRNAQFLLDEHGRAISMIATAYDITDRRRTEAQFRQAQKMEAMGQLTGGVAHDFNNLLGVILGRLDLLYGDLAGMVEAQASVQSCIRAVRRGASLTRSLLAFARQQPLALAELDLNVVLCEIEEMLQRTLGELFEFRVVKGKDLWLTETDPGQLQNAIVNLVLNARDAMPHGGKLTISTSNTHLNVADAESFSDAMPGDYVLLSVTDTGIGMTREVIERAFEPFFTTKETGKGSGLGLSMVYGFVKQSGGHIVIDSEPSRGTTIRIYLPRKQDKDSTSDWQMQANGSVARTGGTDTILVVEDNDDVREVTRLQLERLGYKVLDARDAASGLQLLSRNSEIDLLLTDVILPGRVLGPELVVRAHAIKPSLEAVFMSGFNEHHKEMRGAVLGGPVRILRKPFDADELATEIRAALDRRQGEINLTQA